MVEDESLYSFEICILSGMFTSAVTLSHGSKVNNPKDQILKNKLFDTNLMGNSQILTSSIVNFLLFLHSFIMSFQLIMIQSFDGYKVSKGHRSNPP